MCSVYAPVSESTDLFFLEKIVRGILNDRNHAEDPHFLQYVMTDTTLRILCTRGFRELFLLNRNPRSIIPSLRFVDAVAIARLLKLRIGEGVGSANCGAGMDSLSHRQTAFTIADFFAHTCASTL